MYFHLFDHGIAEEIKLGPPSSLPATHKLPIIKILRLKYPTVIWHVFNLGTADIIPGPVQELRIKDE